MIDIRSKLKFDKESLIALLTFEQVKSGVFSFQNKDLASEIKKASVAGQFEGNKGELFPVLMEKKIVVLCGVGKEKDINLTSVRIQLRRAILSGYLKKVKSVEVIAYKDKEDVVTALIEGAVIGSYSWRKYISIKKDDKTVFEKNITIAARPNKVYDEAVIISQNVNFVRDLINDNADTVTSLFLEKTVRNVLKNQKGVNLQVFDRNKLKAKKFGLLLAVNQGSNKEPRVLIAKYQGAGKKDPYIALVGKGLTYDTGGLNLKPTGHMETMRQDMSGAACVIGMLKTALELKIKKNIIFACGIAENAIDANAYKPGDVITGYSGKTVEIGNTDAEGRLVLADVLAYLVKNEKPARIIDLATLTGAVVVALGHDYTGLVSNDDDLARGILKSAQATDDRVWQLPSYLELRDSMKSKIADIKNTSNYKGAAGTITGAEFLRQFVGDVPWAHLDIAGTAFVENDSRWYFGHGATGAGVRLLTHYLKNN
ncbi:MAG: leucyl aminopeptidase [Candidatus Omnitrophica bacterium]|nr:leucyl aminopeptidase [Candidatus Omnitrophota bacterium]